MRFVIMESPFESPFEATQQQNINYARACLRDCLLRGEAPFASHLLYTQPDVLDDTMPAERLLGISVGLEIAKRADATVVYEDMGISRGMRLGVEAAMREHRKVEYRRLFKVTK